MVDLGVVAPLGAHCPQGLLGRVLRLSLAAIAASVRSASLYLSRATGNL